MPTGDMTPEEFKEFQNNLREAIGNTYTVEVGKILTGVSTEFGPYRAVSTFV